MSSIEINHQFKKVINFGILTKKIIGIVCLLILNNSYYFTQNIKSVKNILKKEKQDTTRVNILNRYGRELILKGKYLRADSILQEALQLGQNLNFKKGEFNSVTNIGVIYWYQDNFPVALQYYLKALKISEETNDKTLIARAMANIGLIFESQNENSKALSYYLKALHLKEELKDEIAITAILTNIGNLYVNQKDYKNGMNYYAKSFNKAKINNNYGMIGLNLSEMANVYVFQGDTAKALISYFEALKIAEKHKDKIQLPNVKAKIGAIYIHKHKYREAEDYLKSALLIAEELGDLSNQSELNQRLSELFVKQHNWLLSYKYYKNYTELKDSIFNSKKTKELVRNEMNFEFNKKQTIEKIEQEKKDALANKELKQKKMERNYFIIGFILMLFVVALVFRSYRQKQKANKVIALQKIEVEKQIKIVDKQKHILEEKHKEITDSINYAERIQRSFLATKELLDANLNDYFVLFKPKDIVSGDFYWAGKLNNGNFALATADSTGHGVPGAIMSILNISCLEKAIEEQKLTEPSEILNHSRLKIIDRLKKDGSADGGKDGMDCSLICFDFKNNKLIVSAANNPVWIIRGTETIEIKPDKMPVGKHDRQDVSFTQQEIDLQIGDVIYTLTDGFPDQFGGEKGKKFMSKNLRKLLLNKAHLNMNDQKQLLEKKFKDWVGDLEQIDDVTIIGVRV